SAINVYRRRIMPLQRSVNIFGIRRNMLMTTVRLPVVCHPQIDRFRPQSVDRANHECVDIQKDEVACNYLAQFCLDGPAAELGRAAGHGDGTYLVEALLEFV